MSKKQNKYDLRHLRNLRKYELQIDALYKEAIREAVAISGIVGQIKPDTPFSFDDYPITRKRIESLMSGLKSNIEMVVLNGIKSEWTLANNKNSELANRVFGDNIGRLTQAQYRRYYSTNDAAREAFQQRKVSGLNLSDRVWRYTEQFKEEIEMGLDIGIRNGRSANELSRDLRQYLRQPEKLFRRVRDEHGQLQLSKRAKAYHPGQGVYRSSYKNARRFTATETNIAYRTSDHLRWQQMDFVVGIEIHLSNNHTLNGKPFHDICDELAGKYPKDFKFTGWHPHCRCFATSILKTQEEIAADTQKILNGEQTDGESVNSIDDVPQAFKDWITKNSDRIENSMAQPYFLTDNQGYLDIVRTNPPYGITTLNNAQIIHEIKAGRITEDIFKQDENWVAQRVEMHEKIVADYTKNATHKGDVVYMLGGAPANGKSTLVDSGLLPHPKGALVIDADKIKAMIPEYKSMTESGAKLLIEAAANFVHEESSYVGKQIQRKAFSVGITPIIDGVNDGSYNKVLSKVKEIKAATNGKRVRADYVTLDTDLSVKLANARAKKTGRVVPLDVILKNNREISKLIPQLIEKPVYDELYLWDTNTEGKPVLILSMIDGDLSVKNAELYQRFLAKAN